MTDHDAVSQAPRGADAAESNGGPGNIDQIRDIIFGAQMRDYDRRFMQLEERLLKDSADLREELGRRHTALEAYIRREIEALGERLSTEQRNRTGQVQEVTANLDQLGRHVERRFGETGEESNRAQRELRGELVRQAAEFDEQLHRRSSELGAALKRESDELHSRKADRAMLGALFAELAARVAEELKRPNDA
jgi:phage-related minor tail protein